MSYAKQCRVSESTVQLAAHLGSAPQKSAASKTLHIRDQADLLAHMPSSSHQNGQLTHPCLGTVSCRAVPVWPAVRIPCASVGTYPIPVPRTDPNVSQQRPHSLTHSLAQSDRRHIAEPNSEARDSGCPNWVAPNWSIDPRPSSAFVLSAVGFMALVGMVRVDDTQCLKREKATCSSRRSRHSRHL